MCCLDTEFNSRYLGQEIDIIISLSRGGMYSGCSKTGAFREDWSLVLRFGWALTTKSMHGKKFYFQPKTKPITDVSLSTNAIISSLYKCPLSAFQCWVERIWANYSAGSFCWWLVGLGSNSAQSQAFCLFSCRMCQETVLLFELQRFRVCPPILIQPKRRGDIVICKCRVLLSVQENAVSFFCHCL